MRTNLFEKHFEQEAVNAVNNTIKNQYDEIVDMTISKLNSVDLTEEDAEMQLKTIRSESMTELKRLSTHIKTNMPIEICEEAVIKAVDEAIALTKAGKIIE